MSTAASREWKVATDPKSGRTYYYNTRTRETTWNKPLELASPEERRMMIAKKNETIQFFREMEQNIMNKIERARECELNGEDYSDDEILYDDYEEAPGTRARFNSAASSEGTRGLVSVAMEGRSRLGSFGAAPQRRVRTISTMDDEVLMTMRQSSGEDRRNSIYARSRTSTLNLADEKLTPLNMPTRASRTSKDTSEFKAENGRSGPPDAHAEPKTPTNNLSRKRRNSTGTIYIVNTMSAQDNDATINCVCMVIRAHMTSAARENAHCSSEFEVFKDLAFLKNVRKDANPMSLVPSLSEVKQFFKFIFDKSQLESDCIIMALIYCERLVRETRGRLCIRYDNWRSILFACLVMASKVWDDLSMWNSDFSQVYPSFDLSRVNTLELAMLDALKYVIRVPASEYAKYYFYLRKMMVSQGVSRNEPIFMKPLDIVGARKLQLSTERFHDSLQVDPSSSANSNGVTAGSNNEDGHAINRRRHMSLHEGLSTLALQRNSTESSVGGKTVGSVPTVSLEQLIHFEHVDADGAVHSSKKKSSLVSPTRNAHK